MITAVGAAAGDGTTITIPAGHLYGDLLVIFAFRLATTAPSLPAGWTTSNTASSGATSYRLGYKFATSNAETSGTWTNATGLVCGVYRGVSFVSPTAAAGSTGTGTSITYQTRRIGSPGHAWLLAFAATVATDSTLETPPTNLTNRATAVGAAVEYAGHDSNGGFPSSNWPSTAVSVGGTSAEWRSAVLDIYPADNLPVRKRRVRLAGP